MPGTFYAGINGVSRILQFFVIPLLLRSFEACRMWIFMPCVMLCCTLYTFVTFHSSGLLGASASFFAIKTMEYSLRGAANEMLYVSLDYESRYLGKKVISLIAGVVSRGSYHGLQFSVAINVNKLALTDSGEVVGRAIALYFDYILT